MDDASATLGTAAVLESTPSVRPARPAPVAPRPPQSLRPRAPSRRGEPPSDGDSLHRITVIEKAIDELRPFLKRDGGDCELVDVDGNTIYVKLTGACVGCHMASVTIAGVQERLIVMLGVPLRVIPVG